MMQHFQGMLSSFYSPRAGYPPMFNQSYAPTMRKGISLSLSIDTTMLSEYQLLVRQQLEIFEAGPEDVESNTQGRKKQVVVGQVGLRCRHCAPFPLRARGRGAVYYPAKLNGMKEWALLLLLLRRRLAEKPRSHNCILCHDRNISSGAKYGWQPSLSILPTNSGTNKGRATAATGSTRQRQWRQAVLGRWVCCSWGI